MSSLRKPKIGVFVLAGPEYAGPALMKMGKTACAALKTAGTEVILEENFISDPLFAGRAALAMAYKHVDGIILFLATWADGPIWMPLVKELRHIPLALWTFPMLDSKTLDTTASFVLFGVMQGTLTRMAVRFSTILGFPDAPEAAAQALSFAKAASTKSQLQRMRIGRIGSDYAIGLYSGSFDHILLRSVIGPEVVNVDSYILIKAANEIPAAACRKVIARIRKIGKVCNDVDQDMLLKAARIYLAAKDIIKQQGLDVVNLKCQRELSVEYGCTACVPTSLIAQDGIVSACEGDIPTTTTMAILNRLSGQEIFYGDIDLAEVDKKRISISTCGFVPYGIVQNKKTISIREIAHKGFAGPINSCRLPAGEVTFARLNEGLGTFNIAAGTAQALEGRTLRQGRFPTIELKLDGAMDKFIANLASQHYAIVYGDFVGHLKDLSRMLDIKFIEI